MIVLFYCNCDYDYDCDRVCGNDYNCGYDCDSDCDCDYFYDLVSSLLVCAFVHWAQTSQLPVLFLCNQKPTLKNPFWEWVGDFADVN